MGSSLYEGCMPIPHSTQSILASLSLPFSDSLFLWLYNKKNQEKTEETDQINKMADKTKIMLLMNPRGTATWSLISCRSVQCWSEGGTESGLTNWLELTLGPALVLISWVVPSHILYYWCRFLQIFPQTWGTTDKHSILNHSKFFVIFW